MRSTRNTILATAFALAGAALANAQTPVSSAFTYQGRLTENGAPANGTYDFYIHLYDAAVGGTPTSPLGLSVNDVPVADGLFTVSLDFGASAFNGDARWLNIQVRPGASGGFYTALTPRQPLSAAPYALYALTSDQWQTTATGVTNANGGFVGINRSTAVNGVEFFGIQAPVQSGYGGMYIRTDGANGKPFYGYSNGVQSAWTYLDGATGDWRVSNGGDRVTVTDTGRVGVGTTSPTARMHVEGGGLTDALYATNTGAGRAAQFHLPGGTSGNAIYGVTYGSGRAASFESHVANATPAVSVFKNGGTAIQTTGDVEVDGEVRTRFGAGLARGTPIAYGKFEIGALGVPTLTSSSGNVIVIGSGSVWTVFITGESDPEDWLVVSNLVYADPTNPVPHYRLLAGSPNDNGSFVLRLRCVENCGSTPNTDKFIHFVVFKP